MRIDFERSGGFAGLRLASTLDTDDLPCDVADNLAEMVDNSNFFELPPVLHGPLGGADRFHYRITIEAGPHQHTIEFGEASEPEALRPLVQKLTLLARK